MLNVHKCGVSSSTTKDGLIFNSTSLYWPISVISNQNPSKNERKIPNLDENGEKDLRVRNKSVGNPSK